MGGLTTPRPAPGKALPATAGATVVALALPVFLLAGWPVKGWALGAVLWIGSELFGLLLARLRFGAGSLAGAGVVAFGMMFRAIAVMVVVFAVVVSDVELGVSGALVYAFAYTAELGLSLAAYFGGPR